MDAPLTDGPIELGAPGPDPGRRGRRAAIAAAVALVAVLVAAVVLVDTEDGVDVSVEETTTSTTRPAEDERQAFPTPIVLGGPDDGKESVGLPVKADPATGLVDGQEVTVTGTGFPPGVAVGVVMCAREAGRDHGARGVDACNIGHFAQADSDDQGVAVVRFSVRRLVVLDGQEVDCASEPGRCLLGMGMISDYDTSGGVLVDFDPSAPLPDPPSVQLSRTTDLPDGAPVDLVADGLVPGTQLSWSTCGIGTDRCGAHGFTTAVADADSHLRTEIRLWRVFGASGPDPGDGGNLDCAVAACELRFWGEAPGGRTIPPVAVSFDPTTAVAPPPVAELLAAGPFAHGDTVPVRVTGLPEGAYVDVLLCQPTVECFGAGGAADASGTALLELQLPEQADLGPCAACPLAFTTYRGEDPGDLPPLLNPEPLSIAITG